MPGDKREEGEMADTSLLKLEEDESIAAASRRLGMSRREFLQFCAAMSATLGLPQGAEAAMAGAVAAKKRPSVIWLHFQECTGCTESLLRATEPEVTESAHVKVVKIRGKK